MQTVGTTGKDTKIKTTELKNKRLNRENGWMMFRFEVHPRTFLLLLGKWHYLILKLMIAPISFFFALESNFLPENFKDKLAIIWNF